jgi:CDP-diacylglycerol--serine O-phosphatidyltransferase
VPVEPETGDSPGRLADFLVDAPNLVTLGGLAVGLGALGLVVQERFGAALCLALGAILIDQLDGRLALNRPDRTPAVRAFGAHLDCYADFVSKGVFPALMLLTLGAFFPVFWLIAGTHLTVIAIRYSYEFVPGAPRRGLSPDYSILVFALLYLASPRWGSVYPGILAAVMIAMAGLNLAPFNPPKLRGLGLTAFVVSSLTLMAFLAGRP